MITVRQSVSNDPHDLAPRMRLADVEELEASSGMTPLEGLVTAYEVSQLCLTAEIDGEVVAMFGVAEDDEVSRHIGLHYGNIWYLGSPESVSDARLFMRESRAWLDALGKRFNGLGNVVDARNTKHVRWIKAMGFTFIDTITDYGPKGHTFLRFYKTCEGLECATPH
jgi:hypothetical protein